jgi:hypothetical protein
VSNQYYSDALVAPGRMSSASHAREGMRASSFADLLLRYIGRAANLSLIMLLLIIRELTKPDTTLTALRDRESSDQTTHLPVLYYLTREGQPKSLTSHSDAKLPHHLRSIALPSRRITRPVMLQCHVKDPSHMQARCNLCIELHGVLRRDPLVLAASG